MKMKDDPNIGRVFGKWTIIDTSPKTSGGHRHYQCRCVCGTLLEIALTRLTNKITTRCKVCGILENKNKNIGKVFGKWRIERIGDKGKNGQYRYFCRCACGNTGNIVWQDLVTGQTTSCRSCGQKGNQKSLSHGHAVGKTSPTYRSWVAMIQRCTNPQATGYENYGKRGITVHPAWLGPNGFNQFLADLGPRPKNLTLGREDNDKGYDPVNARWETNEQQASNRRTNKFITVNSVKKTIAEWERSTGVRSGTIYERIRHGWDPVAAVTANKGTKNG
jgi:hypothetical protein